MNFFNWFMKNNDYSRRDFMKRAIGYGINGLILSGISCRGHGGDGSHKNRPHVSADRSFAFNDGLIRYTIIGDDADGEVEEIQARYNKGEIETFPGNIYKITKPINLRTNILEARAIDDDGLGSSRKLEVVDIFDIPSGAVATGHIDSLIAQDGNWKFYEYDPNQRPIIEIQGREPIEVDFKITKNDWNIAAIKYIDINEPLTQNYADRDELTQGGIDALYIFPAPIEFVSDLAKEFIEKGYSL